MTSTLQPEPTLIPELEPDRGGESEPNPSPTDGVVASEVDVEVVDVAAFEAAPAHEGHGPPHQHHRTHGRLKAWVIVFGVVAVLALAGFASTFTPLFAAESIRVEGAAHLTPEQVRRIAKVEPGVNVFRLDTAKAERRLERNAWIADAQVETSLPSGVTITVHERTPAAITLTDARGGRSVIASDGTILGAATDTTALPTVVVGDGTTPPSQAQRSLGAAAAASLPHSILGRVQTVLVGEDGSVELSLTGGVVVSYGDGSELEAKGQALRAVLLWAERESVGIASVNVETAGAPTATLAGGAVVLPSG